jgi:hypothetical protein
MTSDQESIHSDYGNKPMANFNVIWPSSVGAQEPGRAPSRRLVSNSLTRMRFRLQSVDPITR